MMFPVLTTGVVNSIFFGVNSTTMRYLHKFRSNGTDEDKDNEDIRFCCDAKKLKKYWHLDVFLSGCTAGVIYSFINIPVEVIKTMLQALSKNDNNIFSFKAYQIINLLLQLYQIQKQKNLKNLNHQKRLIQSN